MIRSSRNSEGLFIDQRYTDFYKMKEVYPAGWGAPPPHPSECGSAPYHVFMFALRVFILFFKVENFDENRKKVFIATWSTYYLNTPASRIYELLFRTFRNGITIEKNNISNNRQQNEVHTTWRKLHTKFNINRMLTLVNTNILERIYINFILFKVQKWHENKI